MENDRPAHRKATYVVRLSTLSGSNQVNPYSHSKSIIMKTIFVVSSVLLFTVSSAQTPVVDQIKSLNSEMEKSFMENDMLKVASFYLDTALISAGGRMNIYGRKAIDQYWVSMKDKGAR